MSDTETPTESADQPSEGLRPDVGRLVKRLQDLVGEQTGQLMQYEDLVEQLQGTVTEQAAEIARLKLPAERTPPKAAR